MPRRKHWRTIHVTGGEYHWKVCQPDFENLYPPATDPHQVVIESEQERGRILRVGFPYDPSNRVTLTPGTIRAIIEAAAEIGWSTACAETRYWLGNSLASYTQWVKQL